MEVGGGGGGRRRLYAIATLSAPKCSCIKMAAIESHFNVSVIVRDKVTKLCPLTTTFEAKGKPKHIRTEVPLPTGSLTL